MRMRAGETIDISHAENNVLGPRFDWAVDNGLGLSASGRAETAWGALWEARRALRRIQGIKQ